MMNRITRFIEIWGIFGPFSRDTWGILFPPYRGWDIGCGYCAMEPDAMKARKCARAKAFKYAGACGVTHKPTGGPNDG